MTNKKGVLNMRLESVSGEPVEGKDFFRAMSRIHPLLTGGATRGETTISVPYSIGGSSETATYRVVWSIEFE